MVRNIFFIVLLSLSFPLIASADGPKVAVDIAPLHSLVSKVMEGVGEPDLIIPAESSPHHHTLKPSQATALAEAELVFWLGEEFTPWLEKALNNVSDSSSKISVLDLPGTTLYAYRQGATFEKHEHHDEASHDEHKEHAAHEEHEYEEQHERGWFEGFLAFFGGGSHGSEEHGHAHHDEAHDDNEDHHHDHDGVDPHAWLDPENAQLWLTEISKSLSDMDPDNAETYAMNAEKARSDLGMLLADAKASIAELGELKFVVFHDAYQYFERRFGISAAGSISLGDAEKPSPARIEEIRHVVQDLGVSCVFTEPQYNPGLVQNVFEGTKVNAIGVMDHLGASLEPGLSHYELLIRGMVSSLKQCRT